MICKYCGKNYTGETCPHCHKTIPLFARSMELDNLMSPKAPEGKTYEQGLQEGYKNGQTKGYQKGLQEGYQNGLKSGTEITHRTLKPALNSTEEKKQGAPNAKKGVPQKLLAAALCVLLVAVSAIAGWLIGKKNGQNAAEKVYAKEKATLVSQHEAAFANLQAQHAEEMKSANDAHAKELADLGNEKDKLWKEETKKAKAAGFKQGKAEGFEQGKAEAVVEFTSQAGDEPFRTVFNGIDRSSNLPIGFDGTKTTFGRHVRIVQTRLVGLGYDAGPVDGYYGELTQNAVKQFQKDHGLAETGKVDDLTYLALVYFGRNKE